MAENNLNSPHDRFFRAMMTDPKTVREFFTQNLPINIRKIINFDSISLQKDSFIDDHLRLQIADLLYCAELDIFQNQRLLTYCCVALLLAMLILPVAAGFSLRLMYAS